MINNGINLENWVYSEINSDRKELRQAMHLILRSIALSEKLATCMIMKGGVLLAVRYDSCRFTRDIDFSTRSRFQEINSDEFINEFEEALSLVKDNEYGLALRIQSRALNPNNKNSTFPTLQLKIGYANQASQNEVKRLKNGYSAKTVQVDYSFNEWASDIEEQPLDGGMLCVYAYHDLIAEKLRSVLQQVIRNRSRFQDIYDLNLLLSFDSIDEDDKKIILDKIKAACHDRGVPLDNLSLSNQDVINITKRDYDNVKALILNDQPEFDVAYKIVRDFFESLPW